MQEVGILIQVGRKTLHGFQEHHVCFLIFFSMAPIM